MHCLKRHFTSKMAIGVSSRHRHTHVLGVVLIPYFGWMRIQLYPLFWREQKGTYFLKNWNQTYFVVGIFSFVRNVISHYTILYEITWNEMSLNENWLDIDNEAKQIHESWKTGMYQDKIALLWSSVFRIKGRRQPDALSGANLKNKVQHGQWRITNYDGWQMTVRLIIIIYHDNSQALTIVTT